MPDSADSIRRVTVPTWTLTGSIGPRATPFTVRIDRSPFRIGRRPDVALSLPSPVVSGHHATLTTWGDELRVRDNHSTNGTWINGRRLLEETAVLDGDWLEFGDAAFRVNHQHHDEPLSSQPLTQKTCDLLNLNRETAAEGLHALIASRALAACFQPIYELESGEIYGYEFLARSAIDGVASPAAMFSVASDIGRAVELSEICRECALEHSQLLPSSLPVFLNTHPQESLLETVVPHMQRIRDLYPTRSLVLEIHEAAVTEPGLIRRLRTQLTTLDIKVAFDDYGKGRARFRELISAPSDYIKFDASLLRDLMEVSLQQREFFRSIIDRIRSSGTRTIAEGIESEEMAAACRELGFDMVQGYQFGRPAIIAELDTVVIPPTPPRTQPRVLQIDIPSSASTDHQTVTPTPRPAQRAQ